jgi:hypothetical protein
MMHLEKVKDSLSNIPEGIFVNWKVIFDTSVVKSVSSEILESLQKELPVNLQLTITFMKGTSGDFGHCLLNSCIDQAESDEWIYILDDDNELHPLF